MSEVKLEKGKTYKIDEIGRKSAWYSVGEQFKEKEVEFDYLDEEHDDDFISCYLRIKKSFSIEINEIEIEFRAGTRCPFHHIKLKEV